MKLYELPLICEGFQQIELDNGGGHRGRILNRYAEIPKEWEQEYKNVERTLSKANGLTVEEVFADVPVHDWPSWLTRGDAEKGDMAIGMVWVGIDDSDHDIFKALGVSRTDYEMATRLFNDFFDGPPGDHRHNRMQELYIDKIGRRQ